MAFKFITRTSSPMFGAKQTGGNAKVVTTSNQDSNHQKSSLPPVKLTNSQLNKLAKVYPAWLRDSSNPKQLPGVYHGVLGQVQVQPALVAGQKLATTRELQMDYMNRFTDTERVHQLLSASLLPNDKLAAIWAHVNQTYPGQLTNREVCLALALIAIFQRLDNTNDEQESKAQTQTDPFNLVKSEKKPPVPKLYPLGQISPSQRPSFTTFQMTSSKSTPNGLNSVCKDDLLVDFEPDLESPLGLDDHLTKKSSSSSWMMTTDKQSISYHRDNYRNTVANLIDMDGDELEIVLSKLTKTWLKFLVASKNIFKHSFDTLNVEHGRQSTIEALKSTRGQQFCKQLCLSYPMAHNIKCKIDALSKVRLSSSTDSCAIDRQCGREESGGLFDRKYTNQIDDLMISINEYWAVLINLFHESGQTYFIELIMDGLNERPLSGIANRYLTKEELLAELDGSKKADICSICHAGNYLLIPDSRLETLSKEDSELLSPVELLCDVDNQSDCYYHARCANFWLNRIDSEALPFHRHPDDNILSPVH